MWDFAKTYPGWTFLIVLSLGYTTMIVAECARDAIIGKREACDCECDEESKP